MIADVLRTKIDDSGLTNGELAEAAGLYESQVLNFRRGADVTISTAGMIADALGMDLVDRKKARRK